MHKLVEVIGTPMVVLPVLLDMRAVLASLLALQIVWMLLVPLLLKVVLRDLAMAVHTIAARRAVEDLATTLGASMMAATSLLVETNSLCTRVLRVWRRTGRLDISGVLEHRHLDTDFRNSMFIFVVI
jgi:hypothetical protein